MASTFEALLLAQANFLFNPPSCNTSLVGTQTAATNTLTAVSFDTELFDPYNFHSTTVNPSRIIPNVPGRYQISGAATIASNITGGREVLARLNGTTTLSGSTSIANNAGTFGATGLALPVVTAVFNGSTDFVELIVNQSSGASLSITGSAMFIRFVGLT